MAHIVPFQIDGYTYRHTEDDAPLNFYARNQFLDLCEVATQDWRTEDWRKCPVDEERLVFAIEDPEGGYYGTWGMYRVHPVGDDHDVVSALPAPMFQDIAAKIPEIAYGPGGETVNQDVVDAAKQRSADWWRRAFSVMEWMFMNPMTLDEGGEFILDHWRFPMECDGDLRQHEWYGVKEYFDRYCKLEVLFEIDHYGQGQIAIETLKQWKEIDPDPGRARGSIYP